MNLFHHPLSRFVLVSGAGWVLDIAVFTAILAMTGIGPFWANLVSSSLGASFAFMVSHERIFQKNQTTLLIKVPVYLVYTILTILAASAGIDWLHNAIRIFAQSQSLFLTENVAALIAKAGVTPLTLMLNFIVARLTSERLLINLK